MDDDNGVWTRVVKIILDISALAILCIAITNIVYTTIAYSSLLQCELNSPFEIIYSLLICVEVLVILTIFFVCCGLCRDSSCILLSFILLSVLYSICQIALGSLFIIRISNKALEGNNRKLLAKLYGKPNNETQGAIDHIQQYYSCCGVDSLPYRVYPSSCCDDLPTICLNPYQISCTKAFTDYIVKSGTLVGSLAISVGILGFICAFTVYLWMDHV